MTAYLRAILSGPQLKTVRLKPEGFTGEKGKISYPDNYPQDRVDSESFFLDAIIDRLICRNL